MKIEEALLADMLEHRDEDGPRLVCADWYDDHGDPERAELVRAQCLLARLPADAPERAELQARERGLLAAHGARWAEPLAGFGVTEWRFERGFIESVEVDLLGALRWGLEEMRRLAPLRNVRVIDPQLDLDELVAGLPGMRRLEGLEIELPSGTPEWFGQPPPWFNTRVNELLSSPHLVNALLSSPHLAGLRRLGFYTGDHLDHDFDRGVIDRGAIDALLAGPVWHSLEWLVFGTFAGNFTSQMGRLVTRLPDSPLRVLCLRGLLNGFADVQRLLEVLPRSRLEGLSLDCSLSGWGGDWDDPAERIPLELPWAQWLKGLRWLSLRGRGMYAVRDAALQNGACPLAQPLRDENGRSRLWRGQRWPEKRRRRN
jgi:uncharacterized protein (TIGR02996 family)